MWRTGEAESRVKKMAIREEIAGFCQKFVYSESNKGKQTWKREKELQETCQDAVS